MQVGIIFGAWLTDAFGNNGPLMIVIALKSVIELGIWTPWKSTVDRIAKSRDRPARIESARRLSPAGVFRRSDTRDCYACEDCGGVTS